ncbi:MAG: helix-turn-helix transcriptional regulator [Anaerolineales bacterium]|jgi:transcriptional regulator with XRE-family HTH domain
MELATLEFTEWFNKWMKDSGLGVREAARKIKISHPVISDLQSGAKPTEGTCVKIAIATNNPADVILSLAGYMPRPKEDPLVKVITYLAEQLPTNEEKEDAAEYIRMRVRIAQERGKYDTDKKRASRPKSD